MLMKPESWAEIVRQASGGTGEQVPQGYSILSNAPTVFSPPIQLLKGHLIPSLMIQKDTSSLGASALTASEAVAFPCHGSLQSCC